MLYLHLSDTTIEAIETHKSLIGQEKIVATGRKEIPEGLIVEGNIEKPEEVQNQVKEVLANGYPKPISSGQVSLIIPESQIITKRLNVTQEQLTTEIKNILGDDLTTFEHFYKVIPQEEKQEILYTGMKRELIEKWQDVLHPLALSLVFLSGESFALLAFLQPILTASDVLLYCHIHKKAGAYFVYDTEGPKVSWSKKITGKTFAGEAKTQIEKCEKENIHITKVLLGGEGSIEIPIEEVKEALQKETAKVSDVFETILAGHKIDFTTRGEAKMFFLPVIGALLLTRKEAIPNFMKDKAIRKETVQETSTSLPDEPAQPTGEPSENISSFIPDTIVEYKKTTLFDFLRNKAFFLIMCTAVVVTVLFLGVFLMGKKNTGSFSLFSPPPSSTPTPTVIPSATPTPTIDPKLKRSDLKISVANGTTKNGFAKEIATILEKKGYKNIAKGNADKDTYETTVLLVKEAKKDYVTLLTLDLTDKVKVASTETLPDESSFDAVVRLGNN